MSKIQRPEVEGFSMSPTQEPLFIYTAEQMEAYAAAKVREALEALPDKLMIALTSCPHDIDHSQVVLHFDAEKEGSGALNQISRRIKAALQEAVPQQ